MYYQAQETSQPLAPSKVACNGSRTSVPVHFRSSLCCHNPVRIVFYSSSVPHSPGNPRYPRFSLPRIYLYESFAYVAFRCRRLSATSRQSWLPIVLQRIATGIIRQSSYTGCSCESRSTCGRNRSCSYAVCVTHSGRLRGCGLTWSTAVRCRPRGSKVRNLSASRSKVYHYAIYLCGNDCSSTRCNPLIAHHNYK